MKSGFNQAITKKFAGIAGANASGQIHFDYTAIFWLLNTILMKSGFNQATTKKLAQITGAKARGRFISITQAFSSCWHSIPSHCQEHIVWRLATPPGLANAVFAATRWAALLHLPLIPVLFSPCL
jgi:hypothetical protein